ncbi:hypothetical protein H1230_30185 [Paenibacillus sp. 19GGS1-52]|uniref:hypothetical protein n=1 Tax=Paenibacillus sp. 19GGS1-52 TaxID=2758563 RepID=UPI001EFAA1EC|nr:hypothetical protein [Paenibacillus sp. 19GGS1-52]ULO07158.1 hypothetical protein H1230_30185 [Paenibacillus sp. 19GGS1-52]
MSMVEIRKGKGYQRKYESKIPLIGRRQVEDSLNALKILRSNTRKLGKKRIRNS